MHDLSDKLAVAAIEHAALVVKSILVLEQFILTLLKINKVMIREFPEGDFLLKFPGRNFPKFTLLKSYSD